MREVKVFKMEPQTINGCRQSVKVFDKVALFHAFAQEADGEGQSNPVAIVECADGQVETVYAHLIAFVDGPKVEAPVALADVAALRDDFAGLAMAALITQDDDDLREWMQADEGAPSQKALAIASYELADAMVRERAK